MLAATVLAACSDDAAPGPVAIESPSPQPSVSASASQDPGGGGNKGDRNKGDGENDNGDNSNRNKGDGNKGDKNGGGQGPGTNGGPVKLSKFNPPLTVVSPEGLEFESERFLSFNLGAESFLTFARPSSVFVYEDGEPNPAPVPADLVGWLRDNPYLRVEPAGTTSVGSVEGDLFEVNLAALPEEDLPYCQRDCVALLPPTGSPESGLFILEGQKAQVTVLHVKGKRLLVVFAAGDDKGFRHTEKEARKILKSIRF